MSTLAEITIQQEDKARISLAEKYMHPIELLTRFYTFYCHAEALVQPCVGYNDYDKQIKEIFKARIEEFKEVLLKLGVILSYDPSERTLCMKWSQADYASSEDHEGYVLDFAEDGSLIGIEVFEVIL